MLNLHSQLCLLDTFARHTEKGNVYNCKDNYAFDVTAYSQN